jgi:DSF synthase
MNEQYSFTRNRTVLSQDYQSHWTSNSSGQGWTGTYPNLDLTLDEMERIFWCHLNSEDRPSVTPGLLRDVTTMQASLRQQLSETPEAERPFDFFVVGSRTPGVFNLGGDLRLFAEAVRKQQRLLLQTYAYSCVDIIYNNLTHYGHPVVTIALVQGDALGGGFETALSCNIIVAERSAKFGLPEVLFNLFPGMGAYSLIARRLGAIEAERMILSGKIYTAEELHQKGLVDIVAEDGYGEEAVREYVYQHRRRHNALQAVFKARHQVSPITREELLHVTDTWVEAALRLTPSDLRKMERLASAQDRRCNLGTPPGMLIAAE